MFGKFATVALTALNHLQDVGQVYSAAPIPAEVIEEPNVTYPGDNCCTLFKDKSFGGKNHKFCRTASGSTAQSFKLKDYGLEKNVSSWYCGKATYQDFCKGDPGSNCLGDHGEHGAGTHQHQMVGRNDSYKTLVLKPYDPARQARVLAFKKKDCTGLVTTFISDIDANRAADYNKKDIAGRGMCDNCISSVKLPYGYTIQLFDKDFRGAPQFNVAGKQYRDDRFELDCINLDKFDNKTTSLTIVRNQVLGDAFGHWESITASSDLNYKVRFGFTSSHKENTSQVNQYNLSHEMSRHIIFEGGVASRKTKKSYQDTISHDVENTYSKNYQVEFATKCDRDPLDPDGGVGLWQWVVRSTDNKSKTYTQHYVCRTGAGRYNKSPDCPWTNCIDGHCYQCQSNWWQ